MPGACRSDHSTASYRPWPRVKAHAGKLDDLDEQLIRTYDWPAVQTKQAAGAWLLVANHHYGANVWQRLSVRC